MRKKVINEELYKVLGVEKKATKEEIKKAYRKLARELHPDRNRDNKTAEERFKKVSAAYAVLGDEEKRKMYDQYGIDGLRDGFDPEIWKKYGVYNKQNKQKGEEKFDFGGNFNIGGFQGFGAMEDIFESLFGKKETRKKSHYSTNNWDREEIKIKSILEIELMDAILGRELEIIVPIEEERKKIRVKIPEGIESGKTIRLKGQGRKDNSRGTSGELLLEIKIKKDKNYERDQLDLIKKEKITVKEAYEGVQKEIDTPWGKVKITIPEGTQGGSKLRLKGKGIKKGQEKGDLYIQVAIQIPTKRDKKIKEIIDQLDKNY